MRRICRTAMLGLVAVWGSVPALAQQSHDLEMPMGNAGMTGESTVMGAHMRMTPSWPEQAGDRSRADSIVAVARAALARYRDVQVAEQDGFRMFAPNIKQQRVYHYTRTLNALKARWRFDATAPTSLLYRPEADGTVRLVGAMYTAPAGATLEALNGRLPLSIAQWHQHVNLCLPREARRGATGDVPPARDPRFGLQGTIATAAACEAAGGTFHGRVFGWMAHVNMFADTGEVWEHHD
jgi:hypothetical protein